MTLPFGYEIGYRYPPAARSANPCAVQLKEKKEAVQKEISEIRSRRVSLEQATHRLRFNPDADGPNEKALWKAQQERAAVLEGIKEQKAKLEALEKEVEAKKVEAKKEEAEVNETILKYEKEKKEKAELSAALKSLIEITKARDAVMAMQGQQSVVSHDEDEEEIGGLDGNEMEAYDDDDDDDDDNDNDNDGKDEVINLFAETCRVALPKGWDEDKTGNGPNERPHEFFRRNVVDGKVEYIPEDAESIQEWLSSHK